MRIYIFCLLVFLSGCGGCTNELLRDTPVQWDVNLVALEQQHFDEAMTHLLPEGLIVYLKDPPGTPKELYERAKRQADGAYFQGHLLATVCFKYYVTKDPAMLELAKKLWDAAHMLVTMSGYSGLVARSFGKNNPNDPEYYVRKDGSGDGLNGWIFGANAFWNLIDDSERKAQVAADLVAIVKHLRKHNLKIYENETTPTEYGNFKTPVMGVPIGHYAISMMALANFAVKANSENEDCKSFLAWLIEKDYHRQTTYFYSWFPHNAQNTSNYYFIAFVAWMNDETPRRRMYYKEGIENAWKKSRNWQMALHGLVCKYVGHSTSKVQDAIDRLRNNPKFYARRINQKDHIKDYLLKIVPMEDRPISASIWMRDPWLGIDHDGPRYENKYARVDFLVAYWLGRYIGEYQPNPVK